MYICRHCGFTHNESVDRCLNRSCPYSAEAGGAFPKQEQRQSENTAMNSRNAGMANSFVVRSPGYARRSAFNPSENMYKPPINARVSEPEPEVTAINMRQNTDYGGQSGYTGEKSANNTLHNINSGANMQRGQNNGRECRLPGDAHGLGFATVPNQSFEEIYPLEKGLISGTVFPSLNMPYTKKIFDRG